MWGKIKQGIKEWLKTFSMQPGWLSSKKLERFAFVGTVLATDISCVIYEIFKGTFTATEATILTIPLLTAAGYNLRKTEESKKDITDEKS